MRRRRRGDDYLPKRLVMFVEGKGDVHAVPALASRVVEEIGGQDAVFVDKEPFRVAGLATLVKNDCSALRRWLDSAGRTRRDLGGVLVTLDGDVGKVPSAWVRYRDSYQRTDFCAKQAAVALGSESRAARAGEAYSFATVFAMMEFEAWLLAGVESLRGKALAAGRGTVPKDVVCPDIDIEGRRDAKGHLRKLIPLYSETLDQEVLARGVDLQAVRDRCRSFRRFCSAMKQLTEAVRVEKHVVTP